MLSLGPGRGLVDSFAVQQGPDLAITERTDVGTEGEGQVLPPHGVTSISSNPLCSCPGLPDYRQWHPPFAKASSSPATAPVPKSVPFPMR